MNSIAVVSGGTKGIGRAIVSRLSAAGFDIISCSRNEAELVVLKKDIESAYGNKVHVMTADLSQKKAVKNFVEFVRSKADGVDVLVNNTGYFLPGEICHEPDGQLESQIETNLYSAYYLTRGLVRDMIDKKSGHIFNICSIASVVAYPNGGSYCISKFAMYGMSKVLREELKPYNVRVTSILPGATLTASWEGVDFDENRLMKPEDVAEALWSAYALSSNSVVEDIIIRPQLGDL